VVNSERGGHGQQVTIEAAIKTGFTVEGNKRKKKIGQSQR
jgi:hypothetical protein